MSTRRGRVGRGPLGPGADSLGTGRVRAAGGPISLYARPVTRRPSRTIAVVVPSAHPVDATRGCDDAPASPTVGAPVTAATVPAPRRATTGSPGLAALLALVFALACGFAAAQRPADTGAATATAVDLVAFVPSAWPHDAEAPAAVREARTELVAAREAARRGRIAIDAEVTIGPEVELLGRDDPPRPVEASFDASPEASLSWSPLPSEGMLLEARVLEAEDRLLDAWRRAIVAAWRAPVERARGDADLREAEAELAEAGEARRRALAAVDEARQEGDPEALERAERSLRDAELDLREARIDRDEARRDARPADAARPGTPVGGTDASDARFAVRIPETPPFAATRRYRARALRLSAVVARSERRRVGALLPRLGVEAGYAGSDASLRADLALRDGRARGRLRGALGGTPQERGWVRAFAVVRLGNDLAGVEAALASARDDRRRTLDARSIDWHRDLRDARADAETRGARWRLAEDRLRAAREDGDLRRIARAEDDARRLWLLYLSAAAKTLALLEALPSAR